MVTLLTTNIRVGTPHAVTRFKDQNLDPYALSARLP